MPPTLKLIALVLGQGSVVAVALDADESVGELKKLLCREQQFAFPASGLTLFAAHSIRNGSGKWLRADDPLVRALKKGALAPLELLDEDHEMDPTYPLSDYFSDENAPKLKEIHVLVQLPGAQVAAAPAAPLVSVPAPLVSTTPVRAPLVPVTPLQPATETSPRQAIVTPVVPTPSPSVSVAAPMVSKPTPAVPAAPMVSEFVTLGVQPPVPAQTLVPAPVPSVTAPTVVQTTSSKHLKPTSAARNESADPVHAPSSPADVSAAAALAAAISARAKSATKEKLKRQLKPKTKAIPAPAPETTTPVVSVTPSEEPAAAAALSAISRNEQPRRSTSLPGEKRRLRTTTWSFRASALFFYFHHELGNRNLALTCDAFEIVPGTFRNWVTKSEFYAKWVPFVQELTLREAMTSMPPELHSQFQLSELHPDAKVAIPDKYVQAARLSSKRLHSELPTQHQSIASQVRKTKQRTGISGAGPESNSSGTSSSVFSASAKTIGSGRIPKYPQQETFLMHHVRLAWETGSPLTTAQIYALLRETFGCSSPGDESVLQHAQSEFEVRMGLNSDRTAAPLSQWVSRRLEAHDWTVHARKVVPKVPTTWLETALQTAVELRALMQDVDVLVSADELFLSFYPRENAQATTASANSKEETEKAGCTVVLGCELFSSTLLPPFTIMSAESPQPSVHNACVQPSHWLSPESAKQYVAFVVKQFPDKQVGLIWDTASSHVSAEVLEYITQLGVIVGFIPPGLSSAMQVCDHVFGAKRSVQNHVMEQFVERKFSQQEQHHQAIESASDGKFCVERSAVLQMIDAAVARVRESVVSGDTVVRRVFRMLGQDPMVTDDSEEFERHLQALSDETITQLLTESQLVQHLE